MKKTIFTLLVVALFSVSLNAQTQKMNSKGDNIVGEYLFPKKGGDSKIRISKAADGTYTAQVFWVENALDKNGNKRKDVKNKNKPQDPVKQKEINKNTWLGGIGCGLFLTAASIVQQMGLVYTTAGKAGFITAMYMLFVPIFNLIIFKKNNGLKVWIAVITGIVGMYLLCVRDDFVLTMGDLLILACAILFAGHILCCDNFAPKSDPIKMSAIQFIITGVLSWIFAFITESPSIEKIVSATIPILYCGVISGALGYTLQIVGQRYTDPSTASLLMSLESVFAVIAGVLLLNETMVFQEILGCIIMFAAIILVQLPSKKNIKTKD